MGILKRMDALPKLNVSTRSSSTSFDVKGEASFNIFFVINMYYKIKKIYYHFKSVEFDF
jgi:hypothetical protein